MGADAPQATPGSDVYWWGKYAHLSRVATGIPYLRPTVDSDGDWHEPSKGPYNIYRQERMLERLFTPIHAGATLGYVGDTGVEWGYRDKFNPDTGTVAQRDHHKFPAWDLPHLHLEVYRWKCSNPRWWWQLKTNRISVDPFDTYGTVDRSSGPSPYDGYKLGPNSLWLTDDQGLPRYAA